MYTPPPSQVQESGLCRVEETITKEIHKRVWVLCEKCFGGHTIFQLAATACVERSVEFEYRPLIFVDQRI